VNTKTEKVIITDEEFAKAACRDILLILKEKGYEPNDILSMSTKRNIFESNTIVTLKIREKK